MITCHYCGEQLAPNSEAVYSHVKIHYAENENNSRNTKDKPEILTPQDPRSSLNPPIIAKKVRK
jgi:hypothetical protein